MLTDSEEVIKTFSSFQFCAPRYLKVRLPLFVETLGVYSFSGVLNLVRKLCTSRTDVKLFLKILGGLLDIALYT